MTTCYDVVGEPSDWYFDSSDKSWVRSFNYGHALIWAEDVDSAREFVWSVVVGGYEQTSRDETLAVAQARATEAANAYDALADDKEML